MRAGALVVGASLLCMSLLAPVALAESEHELRDEVAPDAEAAEALTLEVVAPQEPLLGMPTRESRVTLVAHVRAAAADPAELGRLTLNGRRVWQRRLQASKNGGDDPLVLTIERLPLWIGENSFDLAVVARSGRTARVQFSLTRNHAAAAWPQGEARDATSPLPAAPAVLHGDRYVARELVVPQGETLTIRAGTVLRFAPSAGITVHGLLRVAGEEDAPVWFVPAKLDQRWANVVVTGEQAQATFAHTIWYRGGGRGNAWNERRSVASVPRVGDADAQQEAGGRDGGALKVLGSAAQPAACLQHCRILDCAAVTYNDEWGLGGAIYAEAAALRLSHTTFAGNRAEADGGAIYAFQGAALTIEQCRFEGNHAGVDGGAVALVANEAATFEACVFAQNAAGRHGGAMNLNAESVATVQESRFAGNLAGRVGGAFLVVRNTSAHFEACRFVDNRAGDEGGAGTCAADATVAIKESTFARNEAGTTGGGLTIWNSVPRIVGCAVEDNRAGQPDGAGGIALRYVDDPANGNGNGNGGNGENGPAFENQRLTRDQLEANNRIRNNRPHDFVLTNN